MEADVSEPAPGLHNSRFTITVSERFLLYGDL